MRRTKNSARAVHCKAEKHRALPPAAPPLPPQLVVNLPLPAWLSLPLAALAPGPAAGGHWQLNLKWAVRRVALAVGAAMLLYSLATYRDYERESFK